MEGRRNQPATVQEAPWQPVQQKKKQKRKQQQPEQAALQPQPVTQKPKQPQPPRKKQPPSTRGAEVPKRKPRRHRRSTEDKKAVLLLPSAPGIKVLDELRQVVNPRSMNVLRTVEFPSGAALVQCGTESEAHCLKATAVLHSSAIRVKEPTQHQASFRVHQVDSATSEEDLQEDLQKQLGHRATSIVLVPYKEESRGNSKIAVCYATKELLQSAQKRSSILVGWKRCKVDTSIRLPRCTKCHLLGHVEKHCRNNGRNAPTAKEPCLDCSHYNVAVTAAKLPRHRRRDTAHPTNHGSCVTKQNLLRKHLRWQGGPEAAPTQQHQVMDVQEDISDPVTVQQNVQPSTSGGP